MTVDPGRVEEIFLAAVDLPPSERPGFVVGACAGDEALREAVLSLLEHHRPSDFEWSRSPKTEPACGEFGDDVVPAMPERVGRYRITRRIGFGGMGTVYEAEQDNPRRVVALKVINAGILSAATLRRFEYEAHALGRLQHPGIAQIFEADTFDPGSGPQPFMVMELIHGEPLIEYATKHRLSVDDRLALFRKICSAIEYAHRHGVIHRDLKPSNILVDASSHPKVLDFGLAKMTETDLSIASFETEVGRIQGTLPYMSPEQARGDAREIDLRSDIYSLGVVFYELMTGQLPHDLSDVMLHEAIRVICEETPAKPGTINRALRGDLETMAIMAIEKEPSRRYQSASAFADDVDRYLANQPILARPPSAMYQLRKFAKRNKALVVGVVAVFVVLVSGVISTSVALERERSALALEARQRQVAEHARQEAQDNLVLAEERANETALVARFQSKMLRTIDVNAMGRRITEAYTDKLRKALQQQPVGEGVNHRSRTVEEIDDAVSRFQEYASLVDSTDVATSLIGDYILAPAAASAESEFSDRLLLQFRLRTAISVTYEGLGMYEKAEPHSRWALRTRPRLPLDDRLESIAQVLNNLADLLRLQGKTEESETLFRDALRIAIHDVGEKHPLVGTIKNNLGVLLGDMARYDEAEPLCREALELRRQVLDDSDPSITKSISNLAATLHGLRKSEETEELLREARDRSLRFLNERDPAAIFIESNLGMLLLERGNIAEAEPLIRESLAARESLLGSDHPAVATSLLNLAALLKKKGQLAEAESYYREAATRIKGTLVGDDKRITDALRRLAEVLLRQGKYDEAEPLFREALRQNRNLFGDKQRFTLSAVHNLAYCLDWMGRYDEAGELYREAIEGRRQVLGDDDRQTLMSINNLAVLLNVQGKPAEAEPLLREVVDSYKRVRGEDHPDTRSTVYSLGAVLYLQGKYVEAEPVFRDTLDGYRRTAGEDHQDTIRASMNLGGLLRSLKRHRESEETLLATAKRLERYPPSHALRQDVVVALSKMYDSWHEADPNGGHDARAAEWRARLVSEKKPQSSVRPAAAN